MKTKLYCVVYRTGGRENCRWHRSVAAGRVATQERANEVRLQGYKAFVEDYNKSMSIGLPEGYEFN